MEKSRQSRIEEYISTEESHLQTATNRPYLIKKTKIMMPNQKNIMTRYSFIILVMVLIGIAIICKAGVIMFAERQYWKDVADRFVKENVTVRPTRGNIISSDGQLMASSLPEYKIYMDFKAGGHLKDSLLMLYMDSICDGLHQIFPDKSKAEFKSHILKGRKREAATTCFIPNEYPIYNIKRLNVCPSST